LSVLFIARTQPICTAPGCSCPVGLIQSLKQAGLIAEYKGIFVKTAISSKRRFRQNDGIQARFSLDLSAQCVDCRGIAGVLPGYCRKIDGRLPGGCQGVAGGLPGSCWDSSTCELRYRWHQSSKPDSRSRSLPARRSESTAYSPAMMRLWSSTTRAVSTSGNCLMRCSRACMSTDWLLRAPVSAALSLTLVSTLVSTLRRSLLNEVTTPAEELRFSGGEWLEFGPILFTALMLPCYGLLAFLPCRHCLKRRRLCLLNLG
jgi:hypothetical protein